MRVKIEIDTGLEEPEVVIRCAGLDDAIVNLQSYITEHGGGKQCMPLYKGETAYYVPVENIYFFETEGKVIRAHTADDIFETPFKLYELEEQLPSGYMRISKSTIANLDYIYSITRNLTASSVVEFLGSKKKVLVSRGYYKALVERLASRRMRKH